MPPRFIRAVLLVAGVAVSFAIAVVVMMQLIPAPRRSVDYMIIGGAATFAAMLVLFLVMVTSWYRTPPPVLPRAVMPDEPEA